MERIEMYGRLLVGSNYSVVDIARAKKELYDNESISF